MSMTKRWVEHWLTSPDKCVVIDATTGEEWSGRRMLDESAQWVRVLRNHGVNRGDRVAFACRPSGAAVGVYVAILRAGATVVAINPDSTAKELEHFVELASPRLAVTDRPGGWSIETIPPRLPSEVAVSDAEVEQLLDAAKASDLAIICFTSGTTGMPKGVPLTHLNVMAGMDGLRTAWQWTPDDVLLTALPIFHIHGLIVGVSTGIDSGATVVIQQKFDPVAVVEDAEKFKASMFFAVPTMWWRLDEAAVVSRLRPLRMTTSGSAPLDPTLFARLAAAMGAPPVERYGMSETCILTSNPVDGIRKPGAVGLPLPGIELRLSDSSEVCVRGASVIDGYLEGASPESFEADGWFRTGDIGRLDDDGYLALVGRAKELVISGGHNIAPGEVENVIRTVGGVNDVAVVGRPDSQWGEIVVAVVTPESAQEFADELNQVCERELAKYKRPREWHFVSELPRNSMGKVQRHRISLDGGQDRDEVQK